MEPPGRRFAAAGASSQKAILNRPVMAWSWPLLPKTVIACSARLAFGVQGGPMGAD